MGLRQSLYNGTRAFLKDSESATQWAPAVGVGLTAGAGYGMLNGMFSDNTSVFGGTIGGGVFGSGVGAGLAYAVHANKGIRNAARDLSHAALGVNKAVKGAMGETLDIIKESGEVNNKSVLSGMKNFKNSVDNYDGLSATNAGLRGSGISKIHKDDVIYSANRFFEDVMNDASVANKERVNSVRKLFDGWS